RFVDGFADETLDDGFAPRSERALAEAAAKSFDAGHANTLQLRRVTVEHGDAGVREDVADLFRFARLDIVVAEDCGDRYAHRRELTREDLRFLGQSVVGEIARKEQHIGDVGDACKYRLERALGRFRAVQIGQRGYAHSAPCHTAPQATRVTPSLDSGRARSGDTIANNSVDGRSRQ